MPLQRAILIRPRGIITEPPSSSKKTTHMRLAWCKSRQPSAAWCGPPRNEAARSSPVGDRTGREDHGGHRDATAGARERLIWRARVRGVDARVGVGVDVLLTREQQELATPPRPSVLQSLVPTKAATCRRLLTGAEPQPDGRTPLPACGPASSSS